MKKIIWLASWYPSDTNPYTGDFIERHAIAASLRNDVQVLHVVKDNRGTFSEKKKEEHRQYVHHGAKATIIYFKTPGFHWGWLEKLYSNYVYLKIHADYIKKYISRKGRPDGIHVHIGMKAGMAALLAKRKYGIPYVVSEHWSGLCPEARPHFKGKSVFFRKLWNRAMKNASGYTAVSEYLAHSMEQLFSLKKKVQVIPNVVNTEIFFPLANSDKKNQFIHISTLTYQKNAEQILEAAAILKKQSPSFSLLIFGEPNDHLLNLCRSLDIQDVIIFKRSCPQEELAKYIQESLALILYSRFETFGCVIIEANACGKPVIVSDIAVFHETVESGVNGVFVSLNNPILLAKTMLSLVSGQRTFDASLIEKQARAKYAFNRIGDQFSAFYEDHFS
jgi:glycosyltransferase involved in cell wall biosynthesis